MNLSRPQIIILGSTLFIILLFIGIFTGILPGARKPGVKAPEITLTIWGVDDKNFFQDNIAAYETIRPTVRVDYEELNPATYEKDVINALATGAGPDIVMFHNSWLPKHFNKIVPASETQITLKTFQEIFPVVVEQDFAPDGKIYASPLYTDTLALFYNQDTFDKKGIAIPPKDWLDFQNLIPKLRQKDVSGKIAKPAAAIGGSNDTIDKASDLLTLLMLQAGTIMTDDGFTQATFAGNVKGSVPGLDALNFYKKFSDPDDIYYTWNEALEYSLDSFAKGNTAIIFNYASARQDIKLKNPFINFKAGEMPQPTESEKAVNYADYWGLTVTNNSKNSQWAWDLILYLTANKDAAENYLKISERPPALRILIQKYADHPELGVFAKQALSARSWPQIDKGQIAEIFSQMIKAATTGKLDSTTALNQAERQITELMMARR
jgi:multiple sugar transport system substrate-binding protein